MIEIIKNGVGLAASLFGGLSGASESEKIRKELERQRRRNETLYRRRANESVLQLGDSQRLLRKAEEMLLDAGRREREVSAATGGTSSREAVAKESATRSLGEAVSNLAARDDARRSAAEERYLLRDADISSQLNELRRWRRSQIAAATKAVF